MRNRSVVGERNGAGQERRFLNGPMLLNPSQTGNDRVRGINRLCRAGVPMRDCGQVISIVYRAHRRRLDAARLR